MSPKVKQVYLSQKLSLFTTTLTISEDIVPEQFANLLIVRNVLVQV